MESHAVCRLPAQPAIPGERLLVYATGIGSLTDISVRIGEFQVTPAAVNPVPNTPGLYQVVVAVPELVTQTDNLLLSLSGYGPEGNKVITNEVSIAIEKDLR